MADSAVIGFYANARTSFSPFEVYGASVSQASALGAALVVHRHWNTGDLPSNVVELKCYSPLKENNFFLETWNRYGRNQ